ncbi:C1 family peptidase [Geofilum sp. OHC36d9]|uniref:C1 family peptidase n=1 Tax=Geofilum sp. OHC36d9 TaxID=3458413 RepID=UPI0040344BE1
MKTKNFILCIFFSFSICTAGYSQQKEGFEITKLIESTPLKNQQNTGTCWSFATTSFIETEAIRLGQEPILLSPMFYVIPTYLDKAEKYIRMRGNSYFTEGDLTFSVLKAYKNYGAIPEIVFSGKIDSTAEHNHNEMNKKLLEKVKFYVNSGYGKMTREKYRNDIETILTNTMGEVPDSFIYQNKQYTPKSFAEEMIGISPDDYIEITSFSHHPFYSKFILETEANWNNNYYLNLPINDFSSVIDSALENGYSVCWDGDVGDDGYNVGFAKLNEDYENMVITQKMRQDAFDNYTTKDDHNMHVIGLAKDENGKMFYVIKNSDSYMNKYGYTYMSRNYFLLKTISIMVHKSALPESIISKL